MTASDRIPFRPGECLSLSRLPHPWTLVEIVPGRMSLRARSLDLELPTDLRPAAANGKPYHQQAFVDVEITWPARENVYLVATPARFEEAIAEGSFQPMPTPWTSGDPWRLSAFQAPSDTVVYATPDRRIQCRDLFARGTELPDPSAQCVGLARDGASRFGISFSSHAVVHLPPLISHVSALVDALRASC